MAPERRAVMALRGKPSSKRGAVRMNKRLLSLIWAQLKEWPTARMTLVVELNPAIVRSDHSLRFVSSANGRDVFQSLDVNDAIDVIIAILHADVSLPLGRLAERLHANERIDATEAEVRSYLDRLLDIGLLRFRTGIAEHDADWDIPFVRLLDGIADARAAQAATVLRGLRRQTTEYAVAPVDVRARLADEMRESVALMCAEWEVSGDAVRELPFYEDATANAAVHIVDGDENATALKRIREWLELLLPIAPSRDQQAAMRHFFDRRYSAATSEVPLLEFYESFYREHFKAHLEHQHIAERHSRGEAEAGYDLHQPFKLEYVARLIAARSELKRMRPVALGRLSTRRGDRIVTSSRTPDDRDSVPRVSARRFCRSVLPGAPTSRRASGDNAHPGAERIHNGLWKVLLEIPVSPSK